MWFPINIWSRKTRSLLDLRDKGDCNLGIMSGPDSFSSYSCLQIGGLVQFSDHLSSDKGRTYRSLIRQKQSSICLLLTIFSST